jgi:hypothetical protein
MLLQVPYSLRSERQLMGQVQYNLLFRWFIGLSMDGAVWAPAVFSKNREHFSVDGTPIQAWAGHKSFVPKDDEREASWGPTTGYDTKEFIDARVAMKVTPHVAQSTAGRTSAVPEEIAQTEGYPMSQRRRQLIEQGFGWAKMQGAQ